MATEILSRTRRNVGRDASSWVAVPAGAHGLSVELDSEDYSDTSQEVKFHVWGRTGGGDPVFLAGGGYHGGLTELRTDKRTGLLDVYPHRPRSLHVKFEDQDGKPRQIPADEVMVELEVRKSTLMCSAKLTFRPSPDWPDF